MIMMHKNGFFRERLAPRTRRWEEREQQSKLLRSQILSHEKSLVLQSESLRNPVNESNLFF